MRRRGGAQAAGAKWGKNQRPVQWRLRNRSANRVARFADRDGNAATRAAGQSIQATACRPRGASDERGRQSVARWSDRGQRTGRRPKRQGRPLRPYKVRGGDSREGRERERESRCWPEAEKREGESEREREGASEETRQHKAAVAKTDASGTAGPERRILPPRSGAAGRQSRRSLPAAARGEQPRGGERRTDKNGQGRRKGRAWKPVFPQARRHLRWLTLCRYSTPRDGTRATGLLFSPSRSWLTALPARLDTHTHTHTHTHRVSRRPEENTHTHIIIILCASLPLAPGVPSWPAPGRG